MEMTFRHALRWMTRMALAHGKRSVVLKNSALNQSSQAAKPCEIILYTSSINEMGHFQSNSYLIRIQWSQQVLGAPTKKCNNTKIFLTDAETLAMVVTDVCLILHARRQNHREH